MWFILSGDGWLVSCDINATKFSVRLKQDWKIKLRASKQSFIIAIKHEFGHILRDFELNRDFGFHLLPHKAKE